MAEKIPTCVGIILDGNRRWAKERGLPSLNGHTEGLERLKQASKWARDRGIRHMVVYAFSTENWQRTEEEVGHLMSLFTKAVKDLGDESRSQSIAVRFIGERERFSAELQEGMRTTETQSPADPRMTLWVCLSYGGRAEIIHAARKASALEEVTETTLRAHMWSADMPDPDIIIRTGGAKRLSNFLLWQSAYSELFFLEPYWPDFSEAMLDGVLAEYAERERRMGK